MTKMTVAEKANVLEMDAKIKRLEAEVERLTQYAADCNALLIIETAKAKDAKAEVERLRADNASLRKTLEFYANIDNWIDISTMCISRINDGYGWKPAKEAMKGSAQ